MKYLKSTKSTRCRFVIVHESNYLKTIIIPIKKKKNYHSLFGVMRVYLKKKKGVMRIVNHMILYAPLKL